MNEDDYQALKSRLIHDLAREPMIWGDPSRLTVGQGVVLNNATVNVASGNIHIGASAFMGHNVSLLTGNHDVTQLGEARKNAVPQTGRDIVIGKGVWIASNATVIGPCVLGDDSVVCAGAVVLGDVASGAIVAGVPAAQIGTIK